MYYINSAPTENGSYGNPQSVPFGGAYELPDEFLSDYLSTMGFALLTVEPAADEGETDLEAETAEDEGETRREIVTAVERNEVAYNAYIETHPIEPVPGPDPGPDPQDDYNAALLALLTGTEVGA